MLPKNTRITNTFSNTFFLNIFINMKKFFSAIAVLFTIFCAAMALAIAVSSCRKDATEFNPPTNHDARQAPNAINSLSGKGGGCDYTIGSSGIPSLEFTVQTTEPDSTTLTFVFTGMYNSAHSFTKTFRLASGDHDQKIIPFKKEDVYTVSIYVEGNETDGSVGLQFCQNGFNYGSSFTATTTPTNFSPSKFAPYQGVGGWVAKKYLTIKVKFFARKTNIDDDAISTIYVFYPLPGGSWITSSPVLYAGSTTMQDSLERVLFPVDFSASVLNSLSYSTGVDSASVCSQGFFNGTATTSEACRNFETQTDPSFPGILYGVIYWCSETYPYWIEH